MRDISTELQEDFLNRGFTRRHFGRLATVLAASATLPFCGEARLARNGPDRELSRVLLDNNENPLGPCPEAVKAVAEITPRCGRCGSSAADSLAKTFAELQGLDARDVAPYAGSSDPMVRAVAAFASPERGLVVANPTFESAERMAEFLGARVTRVPLREDYSHDAEAMLEADPDAGLYYVCNPNNPSGTLTRYEDIASLVERKPQGAVVLVDEAYIDYTDERNCLDMVKAGKDVVVLRTFSKVYGMAGLRCGLAVGRHDLLSRIARFGTQWRGFLPATAMAAGEASLKTTGLVAERRAILESVRGNLFALLDRYGYEYIPSVANFFMLDTKGDPQILIAGMRERGIMIGRVWSIWPQHVRVSIGAAAEMKSFSEALLAVMV